MCCGLVRMSLEVFQHLDCLTFLKLSSRVKPTLPTTTVTVPPSTPASKGKTTISPAKVQSRQFFLEL